MIHGIPYGFGQHEQIALAVITKHAQRHNHTVRGYRGDQAGGHRAMTVSRIEPIEVSRVGMVQETGIRLVQETGIRLVQKSRIRLVQETGIRLIKKSGIGLVQEERCARIAGDKVVSAGQMAGQRPVRVVGPGIDIGYDNSSSSRKGQCISGLYELHCRLQLVPIRCRSTG